MPTDEEVAAGWNRVGEYALQRDNWSIAECSVGGKLRFSLYDGAVLVGTTNSRREAMTTAWECDRDKVGA